MSMNPLKQYFRRPAVYLRLPSGINYDVSVCEPTETGELPVYPMTAIDEITVKTPDALFNGNAIAELIKSCIPNIKNPWKISSDDIDSILIAIKTASGSQQLELESTCPKCKEAFTYTLDLIAILSSIKSPDYSQLLTIGELSIKFKPLDYSQMNDANMIQFETKRTVKSLEALPDSPEKMEKTKAALIEITQKTMGLISNTIDYVEGPEFTVGDQEHILEFIQNCDNTVYKSIRDYHTTLKAQGQLPPLTIECANEECKHRYEQPFTLNVSDFFG